MNTNPLVRPPCHYFFSGKCLKGDKCRFSHSESSSGATQKQNTRITFDQDGESSTSKQSSSQSAAVPEFSRKSKKDTPCRFYFNGLCRNLADQCEFSHDPSTYTASHGKPPRWEFAHPEDWQSSIPPESWAQINQISDLSVTLKLKRSLLKASQLKGHSYHVMPPVNPHTGKQSRFVAPSTWPALEASRLASMETLFKAFCDWQKELQIKLHPSVFEIGWLYPHIDAACAAYAASGKLKTSKDRPFREFFDPFLPTNGDHNQLSSIDRRLAEQLVAAGAAQDAAEQAVWSLHTQASDLQLQLYAIASAFDPKLDVGVVEVARVNAGAYHLTFRSPKTRQVRSLKVSSVHYDKLRAMWRTQQARGGSPLMGVCDDDIFCCLARLMALGGGGSTNSGLHAAVIPRMFGALREQFGGDFIECFASPVDAHFHRFCSPCLDVDLKFGSLGSFFDFRPAKGHFFVHPPPSPSFFVRVVAHLLTWFAAAPSKDELTVLLLVTQPDALSQEEYDGIFAAQHVVVTEQELAAHNHAFLDGHQHRKELSTIFRKPHFYTSMLVFFQSASAAEATPINETILTEIKRSLRYQATKTQRGSHDQSLEESTSSSSSSSSLSSSISSTTITDSSSFSNSSLDSSSSSSSGMPKRIRFD